MSTIKTHDGVTGFDVEQIEAGLQAGRQLRAQALREALTSLFSWSKADRPQDESRRLPDGVAAA